MRFLLASALTLALTLTASAQPTVEVRLRGVSDLLDRVEYLSKLVDQEDQGHQLAQMVQGFADAKTGIEGIDPARPVGLYGTLAANPLESRVVVVLPIADPRAFLELLTGKLSLDPKKGDDGVYQLAVPNVPLPLYFRFANKSCYVTVALPAALADEQLLAPAALFAAADDAVVSVKVRLDRIPPDLLKTVIAQMELNAADGFKSGSPVNKLGAAFGARLVLSAVQTAVRDGQDLTLRLLADPKADGLAAEVSLKPKAGSELAATLKGLVGRPAVAGTVRPPADAVGVARVNARFDGKLKSQWAELVRAVWAEAKAAGKKKGDYLPLYDQLWAAVEPTLTAGVFDLAAVALPSGDKGVKVAAAAGLTDGRKVEAAVKQVASLAPEKEAQFAFDQGAAGGLTLHSVRIGDEKFAKLTGSPTAWLATGDTRLVLATEADGAMVKALAAREPAPAPLLEVRGSVSRLLALGDDATAVKKATAAVFGAAGPAGRDAVSLTVTGGDALRVRLALPGKAVQLLVLADKERKKE